MRLYNLETEPTYYSCNIYILLEKPVKFNSLHRCVQLIYSMFLVSLKEDRLLYKYKTHISQNVIRNVVI